MTLPDVQGVLLDIDGTLIASNDAHAEAWVQALARHGHAAAFDRIRPLIGKGGDKLLAEVAGLDDSEGEGKAIADDRRDIFLQHFLPQLKPTSGARKLLQWWHDRGVKLAVATAASGEELDALLQQAGVADLAGPAATSSDVDRSKPDPDIVHAAIAKLGVPAKNAVLLGDTPYDVQAAASAGVRCIALRSGGWWSDAALAGAAELHDNPARLLAHLQQQQQAEQEHR